MYFHKKGLEYFMIWVERIGRILNSEKLKDEDKKMLHEYHKSILPKLNSHIKDIKSHCLDKKHLLKQVHECINNEIILPKLNKCKKLSKKERKFHMYVGQLYNLYEKIGERTPHKLEGIVKLRIEQFHKIHNISTIVGSTIKEFCQENENVSEIVYGSKNDFQNNMVSWVED